MTEQRRFTQAAVGLAVIGAGLLDRQAPGMVAPFYALPVAFASRHGGWKGGAVTAAACAAFLFTTPGLPFSYAAAASAALFCLGLALGWRADRDLSEKTHYQRLAENLSSFNERAQANMEGMKRAERLSALGQLSAGLAHEIRNPLASISGAAAILQRDQELDSRKGKCVSIIISECRRLDGLLTNFLNFARPRPPCFQNVELQPILENTVALARHAIRNRTVHISLEIRTPIPRVECDPEQLEQVLLNLMLNAIEASMEGGTVTLAALVEGSDVAVKVIDLGHGVAAAHVDRLFDPFFTTKEHGTGLGLPVAHQIVRQMGGSLLAHKNPGQGMTFSVTLPVERADA